MDGLRKVYLVGLTLIVSILAVFLLLAPMTAQASKLEDRTQVLNDGELGITADIIVYLDTDRFIFVNFVI